MSINTGTIYYGGLDVLSRLSHDADWIRDVRICRGNPAEGTSKEDLMGLCHRGYGQFWPVP